MKFGDLLFEDDDKIKPSDFDTEKDQSDKEEPTPGLPKSIDNVLKEPRKTPIPEKISNILKPLRITKTSDIEQFEKAFSLLKENKMPWNFLQLRAIVMVFLKLMNGNPQVVSKAISELRNSFDS